MITNSHTSPKRLVRGSAALLAAMLAAGSAQAITWDAGASPDINWSTFNNWDTDTTPADSAVIFGSTGSAASGATNSVDTNFSITSLSYSYDATTLSHTTDIASGTTLTITGTGTALNVGPAGSALNTSAKITGSGSLVVNGGTSANILVGSQTTAGTSGTETLDMSGLASFTASIGNLSIGSYTSATAQTGIVKLAGTNSVTATTVNVGATPSSSASGSASTSQLELGQTNTLQVDTFNIGTGKSAGSVHFRTGLSGATVSIANRAGTGAANMNIGVIPLGNTATGAVVSSTVDFSGGTVTANLGTVVIGTSTRGSNANGSSTGTMIFGQGTITATTMNIGNSGTGTSSSSSGSGILTLTSNAGSLTATTINLGNGAASGSTQAHGTINHNGGTLAVGTLRIGERPGTSVVSATYNLTNGTLKAAAITAGAGSATRTFNWTGGTLQNFDVSSDLAIGSGIALTLGSGANNQTFLVDAARTITLNGSVAGTGVFTKSGAGTLAFGANNALASTAGINLAAGSLDLKTFTTSAASLALSNGVTVKFDPSSATIDNPAALLSLAGAFTETLDGGGYGVDFSGFSFNTAGSYKLVSFTSVSGTFAASDFAAANLTLGSGLNGAFNLSGADLSYTVSAIPEPSSFAAFAGLAALGAVALRRRRRV